MMKDYGLYWGDLHSHCDISYGFGTPEMALACAKQQLDFCSITGHAFWPDMPDDRKLYSHVIDYHKEGFARCKENWASLIELIGSHDDPSSFVPFLSYEWHSLEYGDHNIYFKNLNGPLVGGASLNAVERELDKLGQAFMMVPHHIGYRSGQRGINWSHYREARSPLLEVFSAHGCSESDLAPYPYTHRKGLKFGLIGSTDHHGGFPGSYGDGRTGAWASDLSRESVWEALMSRRTCSVTGDKIDPLLRINGAWPGEAVENEHKTRSIDVTVHAQDFIGHVEVLKNESILHRVPGKDPAGVRITNRSAEIEARVRVEWGWGDPGFPTILEGELLLRGGELLNSEPCFRGGSTLSPDDDPGNATDTIPHTMIGSDREHRAWRSTIGVGASSRSGTTQSLIVTVRMKLHDRLRLRCNGLRTELTFGELLEGSHSYNLGGWLSEAVRIHRAVPKSHYTLRLGWEDPTDDGPDFYRLRVAQRNGQWAWTSPIWVRS